MSALPVVDAVAATDPRTKQPTAARSRAVPAERDHARVVEGDRGTRVDKNEDAAKAAEAAEAVEAVEAAIEKTKNSIVFEDRTIEFDYDREIGRVIVKVRANDSGELVRQIPPDEFLKLTAQFRELFGVLFNETA